MLKVRSPEVADILTGCVLCWGNFGPFGGFEGVALRFLGRGLLAKCLRYKNNDRRKTIRIATMVSFIDKQKFSPVRSDFHNVVNAGLLRYGSQ